MTGIMHGPRPGRGESSQTPPGPGQENRMFAPSLNLDLEKLKESENQEKQPRRAAPKGRTARPSKPASPPAKK